MKTFKFILFMLSIPFLTMPFVIAIVFYELLCEQIIERTWWMLAIGIVLFVWSIGLQRVEE